MMYKCENIRNAKNICMIPYTGSRNSYNNRCSLAQQLVPSSYKLPRIQTGARFQLLYIRLSNH